MRSFRGLIVLGTIVLCGALLAYAAWQFRVRSHRGIAAEAPIPDDIARAAKKAGVPPRQAASLAKKQLFNCAEGETEAYIKFAQEFVPDLNQRVVHIARKNIGQGYEMYLLGEMPFEIYDPQPMYCLAKSDCLTFVEQTYAMALARSWPSFMTILQRIRYHDGKVGVLNRNHYTEADWNVANSWLVTDVTTEVSVDKHRTFSHPIDRARFFQRRYNLSVSIPVEQYAGTYIPIGAVESVSSGLKHGDLIEFVYCDSETPLAEPRDSAEPLPGWVAHVGILAIADHSGVQLIHSTQPAVREEPLADFLRRNAAPPARADGARHTRLAGVKILRLNSAFHEKGDPSSGVSPIRFYGTASWKN